MKKTAFIVNTARGPIIDEDALVRALKGKKIAGAGLDVFEREPKVDADLRKMKNVVLNPHLGSAAVETREEMANIVVDNIEALLKGKHAAELRQSGSVWCRLILRSAPKARVSDSAWERAHALRDASRCATLLTHEA